MMKNSPDIRTCLNPKPLFPVLRSFTAAALMALAPLVSGQVDWTPSPDEWATAPETPAPVPNLNWTATARDGLTTTWEATENITNAVTGEVTSKPHRYIEMGSGLNFLHPASGQYQPSQDLIELTPDGGAAALRGPAKLYLKANLNTEGAISIVTVSNRVFKTRPLGIFWYNAQSGQAELVAPVQDCVGELIPPNQIVWKSAFGPIADLRLTYTKSAIESDLVLLQQPQLPAGWDPATTRLEFWHDWTGAPTPAVKPRLLYSEPNGKLRQSMVEPDFTDQILDFGDLWFPTGAGFATDGKPDLAQNEPRQVVVRNLSADPSLIGVGKTWLTNRFTSILVEGLRWAEIQAKFAGLPLAAAPAFPPGQLDRSGWLAQLPAPNADATSKEAMGVGKGEYHPAGFVLDWTLVPSSCNIPYFFNTGETYYVGTTTYFSQAVTFNPGCVVKLTNGTYILTYGWICCNGTSGNPSVLTAYKDGVFGESVLFTACDTCCAALAPSQALWDYYINGNLTITGMRFRWAQTGLQLDANGCGVYNHTVSGCKFEECTTGIQARNCNVTISSSTRSDVPTPTVQLLCGAPYGSLTDIGTADSDGNGLVDNLDYKYFGALGTLSGHAVGQVTTHTSGHSPITDKVIWSTRNDTTTNYAYNTSCWLYGVTGFTAFSPWHYGLLPPDTIVGGGTLITPQHAITVHHTPFSPPPGLHVRFVDINNITYERIVRGSIDLIPGQDHYSIMVFDQPLPSTVAHVRFLPPEAQLKTAIPWEGITCFSRNVPVVAFNQLKEAYVADATSLVPWFTPYQVPEADVHPSVWFSGWGSSCQAGDSGSPVFMLINNELVLIGPWRTCQKVPWTGNAISNVNQTIANLDIQSLGYATGYTISTISVSGFPDLWH